MPPDFLDYFTLCVSLTLFAGYHFYLRWRLRHDPFHTSHAVNSFARVKWVETIMSSEKRDVLAVQTLRNSVMASSFMASTAILLMIGTLTLSGSTSSSSIWHALNVGGQTNEALLAFKLVMLLADFFVAFFCFSMAVRFFNHVGYMINVPMHLGVAALSPYRVAAYLNRAGNFYVYGTRSFFYCVPLVFWIFGPHFMIIATLVLIIGLYRLDRVPSGVRYKAQMEHEETEA
jgi:uncharacterized membrane protein